MHIRQADICNLLMRCIFSDRLTAVVQTAARLTVQGADVHRVRFCTILSRHDIVKMYV